MDTNQAYSPHDLLPAPEPCTINPPEDYFYQNVAKHLIRDTVRIMANGLPIDLERVIELEATIDSTLAQVSATLSANPYIQAYLATRYASQVEALVKDRTAMLKPISYFMRPFKYSDMVHRSYFMYIFCQSQQIAAPIELLPTGIPKWEAKVVAKFKDTRPLLQKLLKGELPLDHSMAIAAMELLAEHKAELHNRKFLDQIAHPTLECPIFNPSSSTQKSELFASLGIESEKFSKDTGEPSWNRDEIERVNKSSADRSIVELTQAFIDHSFGNIIKTNFIPAFYKYTVDGRLHGQYVLFGAKSFRYTSKQPNMLNTPSTKSIYSKPVKRCFIAPPDHVIYAIDLSALEDRVIASLTRDTNKCNLFLEGLDGHCLNAYGYFLDEIAAFMPITGDTVADVKHFFNLQENQGHKELKAIRQKGKPATFGLSYGAYPDKVSKTLKISITAATAIFNNYHQVLYPQITEYRENYVLPTATANGKLHLGLGCYIKTDNPERDIRTLANATCQFWSIITALTINKMHQQIDINLMSNDIQCVSTIYDSIYFTVRKDVATIKWLNDTIVPIITKDFMFDQTIANEAAGEIGYDWASLHKIPPNATIQQIEEVLNATR